MNQAPLLAARGLTRYYGTAAQAQPVLADLDFDLARGEIVAVIGRSGSGKSTLLNLVGQMDTPNAGRLVFAGAETGAWDDAARTRFRRTALGFVFQAYNLVPSLTAAENIALPLELNGLPCQPRVDELLVALGLTRLAARYPETLSGGEQQRVAIARAVAHRPALVLADEPTGNLDQDTAQEVVALFEQVVRESGAALLMATHSMDMVGHADRVLYLRHGHLEPV